MGFWGGFGVLGLGVDLGFCVGGIWGSVCGIVLVSAAPYLQRTIPPRLGITMERERVPYSISLNGLRVISAFWGGSGFKPST